MDLHSRLVRIEGEPAVYALEFMADVARCEDWPMDVWDIENFGWQHIWRHQTLMFDLFRQFSEIAEGYRTGRTVTS